MKILYTSLTICLALFLMSNRSGRGNVTGSGATLAPGETGQTCGQQGCHSGGNFSPELELTFTNSAGEVVSEYQPGQSYTLNYKINNSAGTPAGFGLMMVALDDADAPVNTWSTDLPGQTRLLDLNGRTYVEHTDRIAGDEINFEWIAPEVGTGTVSFYAASALANGNNSPSGDNGANLTVTLTEAESSNVEDNKLHDINVYPNPTTDIINLSSEKALDYVLYNLTGQVLITGKGNTLDLTNIETGQYILTLFDNGGIIQTDQITKL